MKYNIVFLFAIIASLACLQLTFAAPAASPLANPGASPDAAPNADPLADPFLPIIGKLLSGLLGKK
uniref:Vespid chemotactic peptide 5h n=4 Tax=Bilateria TaxID=33213 RepID=CRBLH_VESMG|nr:RecName: Full=Vespid chemotactic peptide 5h; Short=VCP 5h; Flags: Precursor [Vespa magnifica]P0DRA0.1 RecName: Full=Vespid chemotactic peptide VT1; Short=VCP-VT1; Contains: RecName: Full=Vespid chemotactic peptide VT2; Short=VCP-VT2; Flags: Precursor [Vespa tropica]ABI94580.1 vespid chemotactic peptide precursor [Vespa magnifica]